MRCDALAGWGGSHIWRPSSHAAGHVGRCGEPALWVGRRGGCPCGLANLLSDSLLLISCSEERGALIRWVSRHESGVTRRPGQNRNGAACHFISVDALTPCSLDPVAEHLWTGRSAPYSVYPMSHSHISQLAATAAERLVIYRLARSIIALICSYADCAPSTHRWDN